MMFNWLVFILRVENYLGIYELLEPKNVHLFFIKGCFKMCKAWSPNSKMAVSSASGL